MAIVLTGTKTVTKALAPHLPASKLTTYMATALENFTLKQLEDLRDAVRRAPGSDNPGATIGSLLQ